jgi:hypothetical protein
VKLSQAILVGRAFAETQCDHRYFSFNDQLSTQASDIFADALFTAFLGERRGSGLLEVVRALKGPTPTLSACRVIESTLLRAWPYLGARCEDPVAEAARELRLPVPGLLDCRPVSLHRYICQLNVIETRERIADLLKSAHL